MTRHEDFESLSEIKSANLESQLLHLDVEVARGRLRVLQETTKRQDKEIKRQNEELQRLLGELAHFRSPEQVTVDRAHFESLLEAESNLRWLLRRIGAPPFGFVLRLKPGFRKLEERWLSNVEEG